MTYVGGGGGGEGCASSVKGVEKCCMIHHVCMGTKSCSMMPQMHKTFVWL